MQPHTESCNLCSPLRTHIPPFYLSLTEIWQSVTVPEVQLWVNIKSNIGGELVRARQSWRTPSTLTSLLDVQSPSTARGWWSRTCRARTTCFADQREQETCLVAYSKKTTLPSEDDNLLFHYLDGVLYGKYLHHCFKTHTSQYQLLLLLEPPSPDGIGGQNTSG